MASGQERSWKMGEMPTFDWSVLDRLTMGDCAFEKDVLALFHAQLEESVTFFSQESLPKEGALKAHTLKGSALSLGALRLAHYADVLEGLLKSPKDSLHLNRALKDIVSEAEKCKNALKQR